MAVLHITDQRMNLQEMRRLTCQDISSLQPAAPVLLQCQGILYFRRLQAAEYGPCWVEIVVLDPIRHGDAYNPQGQTNVSVRDKSVCALPALTCSTSWVSAVGVRDDNEGLLIFRPAIASQFRTALGSQPFSYDKSWAPNPFKNMNNILTYHEIMDSDISFPLWHFWAIRVQQQREVTKSWFW